MFDKHLKDKEVQTTNATNQSKKKTIKTELEAKTTKETYHIKVVASSGGGQQQLRGH